jgi:hypothetical protein
VTVNISSGTPRVSKGTSLRFRKGSKRFNRFIGATFFLFLFVLVLIPALSVTAESGELEELLDSIAKKHYGRILLSPGSFTYENTEIAGPFGEYLHMILRKALTSHDNYIYFDPNGPDYMDPEAALAFKEVFEADDMEAIAWGRYYDDGYLVRVWLEVFDLLTHTPIGSGEFSFPLSEVPEGYFLLPDRWDTALRLNRELREALTHDGDDFELYATLNKGIHPVYRTGEELEIFVYANRDCHIKVYHIDARGEKTLVFPNSYHPDSRILGGELLKIPSDGYPFRFVIERPYGVEQILVAASPSGFVTKEKDFTPLDGDDVIARGLRLEKADASRDEVLMTMTVARGGGE